MENIQETQKNLVCESPRGFGGFKKQVQEKTEKVDMQEVLKRLFKIEKEIIELNKKADLRIIEVMKRQDKQIELLEKIVDKIDQ